MSRRIASRLGAHVTLLVCSFVALYPLAGIVFGALQSSGVVTPGFTLPAHPDLATLERVWTAEDFGQFMLSSAIVAAGVLVVATPLCVLSGYIIGALQPRGSGLMLSFLLVGLIVPYATLIVPLYYEFRWMGIINTYWAMILPESALQLGFGVYWMRAFFRAAPRSLMDAAKVDGASDIRILVSVLLPLARPAILSMVVLFAVWSWNEFLLPLVMTSDPSLRTAPAALGIFQGQRSTDIGGLAAASLYVSVPPVLLFLVLQRHFIRGIVSGFSR
jgi:raffinose/stachyose/melibiose transport system permease protein